MTYWMEREAKRKYWSDYAQKVLLNPRSTRSERECAAIGVQSFNADLALKLRKKK